MTDLEKRATLLTKYFEWDRDSEQYWEILAALQETRREALEDAAKAIDGIELGAGYSVHADEGLVLAARTVRALIDAPAKEGEK